jgi:hypothetical protein
MKTLKEMKQEIKEKYAAVADRQISTGVYLHTIGKKYVTVMNTWDGTRLQKIEIDDFYSDHC